MAKNEPGKDKLAENNQKNGRKRKKKIYGGNKKEGEMKKADVFGFVFIFILGLLTGYYFLHSAKNITIPHPFPQATKNITIPHPFPQATKNITIPHPFPQATRNFPVLREIDNLFNLTIDITWCIVTEKITGEKYLFWKVGDGRLAVMDYNDRGEYSVISKEAFFERFTLPIDSEFCF